MQLSSADLKTVLHLIAGSVGEVLTAERASAIAAVLRGENGYPFDGTRFAPARHRDYLIRFEPFQPDEGIEALQRAFHAETTPGDSYDFDHEALERLYRFGGMAQAVARDENGVAVGILRVFITHRLSDGAMECSDNIFHILTPHRGGMLAASLWRYVEQGMRGHGVVKVSCRSRLENGSDRMARFMGYEPDAIIFSKDLTGDGQRRTPQGEHHG